MTPVKGRHIRHRICSPQGAVACSLLTHAALTPVVARWTGSKKQQGDSATADNNGKDNGTAN